MARYGSILGLKPEAIAAYKRVHAAVWRDVLKQLKANGVSNYSISLREPENLLFSYYEYNGPNHNADMAAMAADRHRQEWWAVCMPMQSPFGTHRDGEWWAQMGEVFHLD